MNEILLKELGLQNLSEMEPPMSQRTRSLPTPMRILLKILGLTAIVFFLMPKAVCFATQNIQFPEEELASESVLPIFDQPVSVKNRAVLTAQRLEVGGGGGFRTIFQPAQRCGDGLLSFYRRPCLQPLWSL
jgi:hypothetical protein